MPRSRPTNSAGSGGGSAIPGVFVDDDDANYGSPVAAPHGGFVAHPIATNDFGNQAPGSPPPRRFSPDYAPQHQQGWDEQNSPSASRGRNHHPAVPPVIAPDEPSHSHPDVEGACSGGWVTPRAQAAPQSLFASGGPAQRQQYPPPQQNDATDPAEVEGYLQAMHKAASGERPQHGGRYMDTGNPDHGHESYYGEYVAGSTRLIDSPKHGARSLCCGQGCAHRGVPCAMCMPLCCWQHQVRQ